MPIGDEDYLEDFPDDWDKVPNDVLFDLVKTAVRAPNIADTMLGLVVAVLEKELVEGNHSFHFAIQVCTLLSDLTGPILGNKTNPVTVTDSELYHCLVNTLELVLPRLKKIQADLEEQERSG